MKHAKAKASDRGVAAEPAMADVVMSGTTPKGAAASTVRFGSTVVSAAPPEQGELRRNVQTGQECIHGLPRSASRA